MNLKGNPSHEIIEKGFRILVNIDHRGARGAEEKTGDGAGMLLQKPHKFLTEEVEGLGSFDDYGAAQMFLPRDKAQATRIRELIAETAEETGLVLHAWRQVPTDNSDLGKTALESEPRVEQCFFKPREQWEPALLDRKLYVLRRRIEKRAREEGFHPEGGFYICSLDRRTIVYKGLLTCEQLKLYFPELSDPRMESALVLVHSRFSTNTLGAWHLAHPYRKIIHNGEFNTLRGNLNWMKARQSSMRSNLFEEDIEHIKPIVYDDELSDSASFDHVLELLFEGGRELSHALRMMIPEAWYKDPLQESKRRDFYEYHSTLMEPWDGPALVIASDGRQVAAILDRNGLRPCRYCVTHDGTLIMASESGVLNTPANSVSFHGRLKPGQMFLADLDEGRIVPEKEIFARLTDRPFNDWLTQHRVKLSEEIERLGQNPDCNHGARIDNNPAIEPLQRSFGYTVESLRFLLQPMAEEGKDPVGAMGTDTPPAALSARYKPLFNYFTQEFAQVSNPPLDYLREALVTSLESYVGCKGQLLEETPEHCRQLFVESPILDERAMEALSTMDRNGIRASEIDITYPREGRLKEAVETVREKAVQAIKNGAEILILSDADTGPDRIPIPSLLAVGGLHHHLIRRGLRTRAGLILYSGHPATVHHYCTLLGYGADAVCPWLAYRSLHQLVDEGLIQCDHATACDHYRAALEGGLLKVMSKMGIATLESYKGAQIFEAVGLDFDFVESYFTGTTANVPGIGLPELEREQAEQHRLAYEDALPGELALDQGGDLYWRRDGEIHQWNPFTVGRLQHAVRSNDFEVYREYAEYINEQEERLQTLRGMLEFKAGAGQAVPLAEVEPVESLFRRFSTGSMSFGALSLEAHEVMAVAMNRIGGKSGTGEGGEQIERFGTERECSMKQAASGRFGVTIHYLVRGRQIEIKMAQGSKPGEGGELPGSKVNEEIAKVRLTTPGVGLISPPPHHDIYSIEDLAQLIHDLKCSNPDAEIHVKLVSKAGVGTIAAGVAKGRADAILISGDSGGTGASVKTSIKSAGAPWELGLAETQQTLLANNLRSRITLRADGGFKTGRDVAIAALLGAEEYGFGTAPLVTVGCIMLRKCHCNTCSVGVATQDPELRKKFPGRPEDVIHYMHFVAEELREIMAMLGFRTMEEMIGRVDRLRQKDLHSPKGISLDLGQLLYRQPSDDTPHKTREQNHNLEKKLDHELIRRAGPALQQGKPVRMEMPIKNPDRTVGTLLSSHVARHRDSANPLPPDAITVHFHGYAGQSFGAFLAPGISFSLSGNANDYLGKGLSGGKLVIRTPEDASFAASENVIIGNVALFGATSGEAYINGLAGERFAVRNSGALAVVEGVGNHGCEYMTGGVVIILGETGKNFAAGMSGGEAYIFDESGEFEPRVNPDQVTLSPLAEDRDRELVRLMIQNHLLYTGSEKARGILENWERASESFVKVLPDAYSAVVDKFLREGRDIRQQPPQSARGTLTCA